MDREEEDGAGAEEGSGERLCFEAGVGLREVRVSELEEDRGEASRVWRKEGDGKARVLVSGERRTGKCNREWWGGGEGGGIGGGSPATVRTERQQREQLLQRPIPVSVPRSRDIQSFGMEDTEDRPQRDDKRHPVTYFFLFHASDICSHFSQRGAPTAPAPALGGAQQ